MLSRNLKNISARMNCGNKEFIDSLIRNGIPHHNGIVYGDILNELEEFANLIGIPLVILGDMTPKSWTRT